VERRAHGHLAGVEETRAEEKKEKKKKKTARSKAGSTSQPKRRWRAGSDSMALTPADHGHTCCCKRYTSCCELLSAAGQLTSAISDVVLQEGMCSLVLTQGMCLTQGCNVPSTFLQTQRNAPRLSASRMRCTAWEHCDWQPVAGLVRRADCMRGLGRLPDNVTPKRVQSRVEQTALQQSTCGRCPWARGFWR
jgi:hypothetical protein